MLPPQSQTKRLWKFALCLGLGLCVGQRFFEYIRVEPNFAFNRQLLRAGRNPEKVTTIFLGPSPLSYAVNSGQFDEEMKVRGVITHSLNLSLGGSSATQMQELFEKVLALGLPNLQTVYLGDILIGHHLRRRSLNKNESITGRGLYLYVNQLIQEPKDLEWVLACKDLLETVFFRATNWGVAYYTKLNPSSDDGTGFIVREKALPWGACHDYQDWIQPLSKEWHALAKPIVELAKAKGATVNILRLPFRTPASCKGVQNCLQPLSPEVEREIFSEQYWWDCDHLNVHGATLYTRQLVEAHFKDGKYLGTRGLSSM